MKQSIFLLVIFTALIGEAMAQSCPGEVMHFRETFGTGTSGAPLAPGRTNYAYKGSGSLADGDYRLSNTTQGRPEWHNVPDHTGNTDGRMMVTNASYTPGEFFRDTVFGLSSTHTYSVYFYAMNVNTPGTCAPNPILPQLELVVEAYNVDGSFTHLSTIVSDSMPQRSPAQWVRIAGTYYLPVNVTAIRYRIINHSTGGCGNDIAIDDITFSQCQPQLLAATGLSLKGKRDRSSVKLSWSAKDYYASFDIEKSENGNQWAVLKNIRPVASNKYMAEDAATNGDVQYRIAAITVNGRRYYSNVINVKEAKTTTAINAYPNPFFGKLNVQITADQAQQGASLKVFDTKGQLLYNRTYNIAEGDNRLSVNDLDLRSGLYFVSVSSRNGAVLSHQRIVKK